MSRAQGALAILLLPAGLTALLLARAAALCPGLQPGFPATPGQVALLFAPTAAFALLYLRARVPAQRRTLLIAVAAYAAWTLWMRLPAALSPDCGAPGPGPVQTLALFAFTGTLAALLANKINCLTGACRA